MVLHKKAGGTDKQLNTWSKLFMVSVPCLCVPPVLRLRRYHKSIVALQPSLLPRVGRWLVLVNGRLKSYRLPATLARENFHPSR